MIDNLGRNIDAGMGSADLKGLVESLAKGNVGEAKPFNKANTQGQDKLISDLKSQFSGSFKKMDDLLKSIKNFMRNGGKASGKDKGFSKEENLTNKAMKKLAEKGLKKGSIYTHDTHSEKILKLLHLEMRKQTAITQGGLDKAEKLAAIEREIVSAMEDLSASEKKREASAADPSKNSSAEKLEELERTMSEQSMDFIVDITEYVDNLGNSIGELQSVLYGFRATEVLFGDLVAAERKFTIDTRQIAFEIAGATRETKSLQRSFESIGKTTSETGFDRNISQQQYLKILKKGTKDSKSTLSIMKNQLNTERMIGVEAGGLGDLFTDMSLQMGMNNSQMAQFGRGVQEVARNTGVTGDNLARAVQSSEGIMQNMRKAGTLTSEAASNVVGLMASAEKFGVGDFAQGLGDVLSQGMTGFIEADQKMQIILGQALGHNAQLMEQMRNGTIMQTKEGMRGLAEGMEDTLARFSGGRVRTAEDFAKLSDQEKMLLNTRMKMATGKTATEFLQVTKSLNEAAEPLSKKLEKIAEQKKKNLSTEERMAVLEQERSIKVGTSLSALTKLDEELKKTGGGVEGMQQALASLQTGEMAEELKAIGVDTKDAGRASIEKAMKGLNEGLAKLGQSSVDISADRIEKAMSGDSEELGKIMEELNSGQQKLATAQKDNADPMTQLRRSMEKLNDTLRGTTQGAISAMMSSAFGDSLGMLTTIADVGGKAANFVGTSVLEYGKLRESVGKLSGDLMSMGSGLSTMFPGVASSLGGLGGSLGSLGASAMAAAGPIALAVAAIIGVAGGLSQAAESATKAGDIFGKSMEEVTTAEYYAAKSAGFMTGSINTLTFGIFDSWIGPTGVITVAIAKFNKMIPIMSALQMALDAWMGAIWGIMTSIKDIFVGVFEGIYYAVAPIGELFTMIGNAISDALGPLFNFGSTIEETGTVFEMFAGIFGYVGKVIRNIFVGIGKFIGGIVSIVVKVLGPAITFIGKIIGGIAAIIGHVFESIYDYFRGMFLFFEGLFNLDFSKMGEGLWNMFTSVFLRIPTLLWDVFSFAFSMIFVELPKYLLAIPKMIFDSIWSGLTSLASNDWVGPIFQPFLDILKPIQDAMSVLYTSLEQLWHAFDGLWSALGELYNSVSEIFSAIGELFGASSEAGGMMEWLAGGVKAVSKVIGDILNVALIPLKSVFWVIGEIIQTVAGFIIMAIDAIKGLITWVKDWVTYFGNIPGAIGEHMYSAASAVGLGWLVDSMLGTTEGKAAVSGGASPVVANETAAITEGIEQTKATEDVLLSNSMDGLSDVFEEQSIATQKILEEALVSNNQRSIDSAATDQSFLDNLMSEIIPIPLMMSSRSAPRTGGEYENAIRVNPIDSNERFGENFAGLDLKPTINKTLPTVASAANSNREIEDRIQRDRIGTEVGSDDVKELSSIASASETQVSQLDQVIALLSEMSRQDGGSIASSETTQNVSTSPPKYYKWSIGKHNQTPALGVSNLANIG